MKRFTQNKILLLLILIGGFGWGVTFIKNLAFFQIPFIMLSAISIYIIDIGK